MKQIWGHQRIIGKNRGSSKEIGYQLKGDLYHMYRFIGRQIVDDLHPQETCTYEMVEEENTVSKREVMNIQKRLLLKSIAHSSNLSHCI